MVHNLDINASPFLHAPQDGVTGWVETNVASTTGIDSNAERVFLYLNTAGEQVGFVMVYKRQSRQSSYRTWRPRRGTVAPPTTGVVETAVQARIYNQYGGDTVVYIDVCGPQWDGGNLSLEENLRRAAATVLGELPPNQ